MIVRTLKTWKRVVDSLRRSPVFAFDTETTGLDWPDVKVVGFSLAWEENGILQNAYVPVGHSSVLTYTGEPEEQLSIEKIKPGLKQVLEDPRSMVIMHNAKYDIKIAKLMDIFISEHIFDTLIASYLLNTDGVGSIDQVLIGRGSHGLKDLVLHHFKHKMTELTSIAPKIEGVLRVDLVPISELGDYASDDAVQTYRLWEKFSKDLEKEPRTEKIWEEIQRESVFCLADMEMFGVELDKQFLVNMREKVEDELETIVLDMYVDRPGEDFSQLWEVGKVKDLLSGWENLDLRFSLDRDNPKYPKNKKGKPAGKGYKRKELIKKLGFEGHPLVDKVKDNATREELKKYPHLAHKLFKASSTKDLNQVLFVEEGLAPFGEKGKNGLYSTKAEFVETWANAGNKIAKHLLRHRELSKLYGTYLVGMVGLLNNDGRLRTNFNQTGARTGRLSSSNPNLQNQPNSEEFPIRKAFVATGIVGSKVIVEDDITTVENEGGGYKLQDGKVTEWWGDNPPWVLGVADYSQLEVRLLACASEDEVLIKALLDGQDIHALTARAVFDEIPDDLPLDQVKERFAKLRGDAKPVNFGVLYGMGPNKLARTLGISVEEAEEIINVRYMGLYKGVSKWIEQQHLLARKLGYCKTAIGRKRHLPAAMLGPFGQTRIGDKVVNNGWLVGKAERQAQNTPIQGFAADVVMLAMRDIRRYMVEHGFWDQVYRMLLQVHDEIVWEMHPCVANALLDVTVEKMESVFKLQVPLTVTAHLGTNWQETKG